METVADPTRVFINFVTWTTLTPRGLFVVLVLESYTMTFSIHQEEVVMSSQIMLTRLSNTHPLAHISGTCALIFSSYAPFTVYSNRIMKRHPTPIQVIIHQSAREGGPKERTALRSSTYAPRLSTPSHISCIVAQPPTVIPQLFKAAEGWHHPSSLTSVYQYPPSTHNLLKHPSGHTVLIHSLNVPNHLNTIWSALLANSLPIPALLRTSSFITLPIRDTPWIMKQINNWKKNRAQQMGCRMHAA